MEVMGTTAKRKTPVRLNVYDMYWLNDYASNIGVGIFHSGIEIFGVEYAYGGHPYQFSGVFENSPQDAEELGDTFKFKESIVVGETDQSSSEIRRLIKQLGDEFRGDRYHLISRNCNHFSAVLARKLTGKEIPGWINRLANLSGSIPFLEKCIPQEWLTPIVLQASVDEKKRGSVDSAEEATEKLVVRSLNDSRTTIIDNRTANGAIIMSTSSSANSDRICMSPSSSSSSSSSSSAASSCDTLEYDDRLIMRTSSSQYPNEKKSRSNSPPIFRFWNTIKNTINGGAAPLPTGTATVIPASAASSIGKASSPSNGTGNGLGGGGGGKYSSDC
ncbi:hypothetical protein GCK72_017094 [Caenorhabditis remanei]|uniref:PPPDE domain-containing protein n=1 Tax=Caenorhabditis remanei TaxID=31234 RepID=A0A6A5G6Y0_CAERE|nr:hypothetical protein GCK72_017094 [Caenorhabditis remanei]KAF1750543.1 hypothetical protein GCK72_017094 [Caenorhabditis remanei]